MWNAELTRPKKDRTPFFLKRGFIIGGGVASILLSLAVLGLGFYEGFLHGGRIRMIELPGFHELKLDTPGLYAGVYQHRGSGPLPVNALAKMDVRVMSKEDYEEVPVLMNTSGQTFNGMGMQGMPLFNFAVSRTGDYTLSGIYTGGSSGPAIHVLLFPQTAQNIKQTIIVAVTFFLAFLFLGIFVLVRVKRWAPKKNSVGA